MKVARRAYQRFHERGTEGMVFPGVPEEPRICGLCLKSYVAPATHHSTGSCKREAKAFRVLLKQNPPPWLVAATGNGGGGSRSGAWTGPPDAAGAGAATGVVPPQGTRHDEAGDDEPSDGDEDYDDEDYDDEEEDSEGDDGHLDSKRAAKLPRTESRPAAAGARWARAKKMRLEQPAVEGSPARETPRKTPPTNKADEGLPLEEERKLKAKVTPVAANREVGNHPANSAAGKGGDDSSDDLVKKILSGLCVYIQSHTPKQEGAASPQGGVAERRYGHGLYGDQHAGIPVGEFRGPPRAEGGASGPGNARPVDSRRSEWGDVAPRWEPQVGPSTAYRHGQSHCVWALSGTRGLRDDRHLESSPNGYSPSLPHQHHHPRSEDEYARSGSSGPDSRYRYSGSYGHPHSEPGYNDRHQFAYGCGAPPGYTGDRDSRHRAPPPDQAPYGCLPCYDSRHQRPEEGRVNSGNDVAAASANGGPFANGVREDDPSRGRDSTAYGNRLERVDAAASYSRPPTNDGRFGLEQGAALQPFVRGEGACDHSDSPKESGRTAAGGYSAGTMGVPVKGRDCVSHTGSNGRGCSFENHEQSRLGPTGIVTATYPGNPPKKVGGAVLDDPHRKPQAASEVKPAGTRLDGDRVALGNVSASTTVATTVPRPVCFGRPKTFIESSKVVPQSCREAAGQPDVHFAATLGRAGTPS
jgi:hypothetical protein